MKTYEFILRCIGCYVSACAYMDRVIDAFDIELTEDDVQEVFTHNQTLHSIGNELISRCFDKIVEKAQEAHPEYADELPDLFDYYCDDYASSLCFNKEQVSTWDGLEKEIENRDNGNDLLHRSNHSRSKRISDL